MAEFEEGYRWGLTYDSEYILSGPKAYKGWLVVELVDNDGTYSKHVGEPKDKLQSARRKLWDILGPLVFFDRGDRDRIEISKGTRLHHLEKDRRIVAENINIQGVDHHEYGETYIPYIMFSVEETNEYLKLYVDEIEEKFKEDTLLTPEQFHNQIMDKLG